MRCKEAAAMSASSGLIVTQLRKQAAPTLSFRKVREGDGCGDIPERIAAAVLAGGLKQKCKMNKRAKQK
jgi:hypothetical protein